MVPEYQGTPSKQKQTRTRNQSQIRYQGGTGKILASLVPNGISVPRDRMNAANSHHTQQKIKPEFVTPLPVNRQGQPTEPTMSKAATQNTRIYTQSQTPYP
jgi:hypothetical protein